MTRKQLALWFLTVGLLTGCTFITQVFVRPTPRAAVVYVASNTGNDAAGTPCTDAQPCSVRRGLITMSCSNNDVLELLGSATTPSVYQGTNYMLDLSAHVPGKSGTSDSARCTVRARNDGGVFIDGQFTNRAFFLNGHSYWTFQGIDVGNAGTGSFAYSVAELWSSHHNLFQRICASNARYGSFPFQSGDGWAIIDSADNLFEDICGFGTGGNILIEDGAGSTNNVYRRVWLRWEGQYQTQFQDTDCGGPPVQIGYGTHQTSTYENVILIYDPEQIVAPNPCVGRTAQYSYGSLLIRNVPFPTDPGYKFRGFIVYGYNNPNMPLSWNNAPPGSGPAGIWLNQGATDDGQGGHQSVDIQDLYVDALSQPSAVSGPIGLGCTSGFCANQKLNRVTSLRGTQSSSLTNTGEWALYTNFNECTSLAGCPNFYTGGTSPAGARNCFEYTNGVLGSTAATQGLWPWRMDTRIKAALARAKAAGTGGNPLQGGAGSGYAAGTVTSEIASRYGPIPAGCSRTTTAFTPDFPVVTDFPATGVLDTFDRANGPIGSNWTYINAPSPGFTISGGQVTATTYTRALWNVDLLGPAHESHATWTTAPPDGTDGMLVMAANTTGDDNGGWHLVLRRVASGNDRLVITRIPGGYAEILDVDLGGKVADGNLFGLRISATQTISMYWRYNGVTYRVGSVIDTNLPLTSNQRIGLGGSLTPGVVINDFGGSASAVIPPNPGSIGRFGNLFPKQ